MLKEFKKFVMRGNILDMAVGIILGASFTQISNSLVRDILMPPIGMLLNGMDFSNFFFVIKDGAQAGPYGSIEAARASGAVVIGTGIFINTVISFFITVVSVFIIIRFFNKIRDAFDKKDLEVKTAWEKECPYCRSLINIKAVRCPNCTSMLDENEIK